MAASPTAAGRGRTLIRAHRGPVYAEAISGAEALLFGPPNLADHGSVRGPGVRAIRLPTG